MNLATSTSGDFTRQTQPPLHMADALDREEVMERVGHDLELLVELIALFREDAPLKMIDLRKAIQAGNSAAFQSAAHGLKGMVSNFSTGPAYCKAGLLELAAASREWEAVPVLLKELESQLSLLDESLASLVVEVSSQSVSKFT